MRVISRLKPMTSSASSSACITYHISVLPLPKPRFSASSSSGCTCIESQSLASIIFSNRGNCSPYLSQIAHEGFHQIVDFVALKVAVRNGALLIPNARKQPHLAAIRQRAIVHAKHFLDFAPAPDFVFEDGVEF